jgi:hypothetical protein
VASPVEGNAEISVGVLPAGRYATVVHTGHPDTLVTATRDLLEWATERGLDWDADGDEWGCRLEEYLSDPAGGAGHGAVADEVGIPAARLGAREPASFKPCAAAQGTLCRETGMTASKRETRTCMKLSCMAYSCEWRYG